MKTIKIIMFVAATGLLSACGSKRATDLTAGNVTIDPIPLTYVNKTVPASLTIQLPPQFVGKTDLMTLSCELRYGAQHQLCETAGETLTVQGEMLESHYPIVSYKNGKRLNLNVQFPYKEGMDNGQLFLKIQKGPKVEKKTTQRELKLTEGVLCTPSFAQPILNTDREAEGLRYLQQGRYTLATAVLEQLGSNNNTVLAQILSQDYAAAQVTLTTIATPDALTHYLKAVLGARMNNEEDIRTGLKAVANTNPQLAKRALTDLEFQHYQSLVRDLVKE